MSIAAVRPAPDLLRRVVRLQILTIVWMSIEAVVALVAAWTARSPALLGFGGDSAIELFSPIIVLCRFRSKPDSAVAEKLAARVAGGLLFFVAAFVIVSSGLSLLGYREPQPSFAGIILLIVATPRDYSVICWSTGCVQAGAAAASRLTADLTARGSLPARACTGISWIRFCP